MTDFPRLDTSLISVDVESTGLDWKTDHIFGIAVTDRNQSVYYDIREEPKAMDWVQDQIRDAKKIVNHHMKFDIHMLQAAGVDIDPRKCECTMIRAALINEHYREYSLDACARRNLGEKKHDEIYQELANMFGGKATRKVQMKNISKAPSRIVDPYAKKDVEVAMKLWLWQEEEIKRQELERVFALEQRLFPHVLVGP